MARPASWRRNLLASTLGSAWIALVQVAFIPVYISILGVEAWGLIGALAFLLALFWVLDSGVAQAVSREVARALAGARPAAEVRTILRSVEVALLGAALVVGAAIYVAAPWIVDFWFRIESFDPSSAVASLRLLGVQLAFRVFASLYRAVLAGAQDLVWVYSASAAFATVRGAGVIPAMLQWPSLEVFFGFQAAVMALEACVLGWKSRRVLPNDRRATFSAASVGEVLRFSAGASLASLLCLLLAQADRAILPATIPLADFGAYVLSATVATAVGVVLGPIATTARFKLNELAARGDPQRFTAEFHRVSQWIAVAAAPVAFVLAAFAEPLLVLWTGNARLGAVAAPMLVLLALAGLLNACSALPYMVPLANGRARGLVRIHSVAFAFLAPAIYFGSSAFGVIAAALANLAVAGVELLAVPLLLRGDLPQRELRRWMVRDVFIPVAAAGCACALVRAVSPTVANAAGMPFWIVGSYVAALAATWAVSPDLRQRGRASLTPPLEDR